MNKKQLDSEFRIRRLIALSCISAVFLITIACFAIVIFGNEGAADRMNAVSVILSAIVLALTSNFAHYCDQVYRRDKLKEKENEPIDD